jgi:hypothetical protein
MQPSPQRIATALVKVVEAFFFAFGPNLDSFEQRAGLVGPGPSDCVRVIEVHMRVDERLDDQSSAGVEEIGVRTVIVPVGVGRACHDRTELRIVDADVPRSRSSPERRVGNDHSRASCRALLGFRQAWCRPRATSGEEEAA